MIKLPPARVALEAQRVRSRGGYTSIRLTKVTRERLRRELENRHPTATLETILNAWLDSLELEQLEPRPADPHQLVLHTSTRQDRA